MENGATPLFLTGLIVLAEKDKLGGSTMTEANGYTALVSSGLIASALTYNSWYGVQATGASVSDTVSYSPTGGGEYAGILALKPLLAPMQPLFGNGAPTFTWTPTVAQTGSGGSSIALGSTTPSGHIIIVGTDSFMDSTPSVSDSLGTSFANLCGAGGDDNFSAWAGSVPTGGMDTISVGGGSYLQTIVYDVANLTTTVDVGCSSSGYAVNPSLTTVTTLPNDFILAKFGEGNGSGGSIAVSSPWVDFGTLHSGYNDLNLAYQVGATAGSYTASWTAYTPGSANNVALAARMVSVAGTQGRVYYDTSTTPYTEWVYNAGAWHKVQ